MKTFKPTLLLLALCALLLTGMQCRKDGKLSGKEELPSITRDGRDTFGFLLNGEVWIPRGGLLDRVLDFSYSEYNGIYLIINANRYLSPENSMKLSISLPGANKTGTYYFNNEGVRYSDTKSGCYYSENRAVSGSVTITRFDLANNIISGTFEFKLEMDGCPIINATQGRFDLKK